MNPYFNSQLAFTNGGWVAANPVVMSPMVMATHQMQQQQQYQLPIQNNLVMPPPNHFMMGPMFGMGPNLQFPQANQTVRNGKRGKKRGGIQFKAKMNSKLQNEKRKWQVEKEIENGKYSKGKGSIEKEQEEKIFEATQKVEDLEEKKKNIKKLTDELEALKRDLVEMEAEQLQVQLDGTKLGEALI